MGVQLILWRRFGVYTGLVGCGLRCNTPGEVHIYYWSKLGYSHCMALSTPLLSPLSLSLIQFSLIQGYIGSLHVY